MKYEPLTDEQRQKLLELGSERLGAMCLDVNGDCPMNDLSKRNCVFPSMPCHAVNAGVWRAYLQEAEEKEKSSGNSNEMDDRPRDPFRDGYWGC